MLQNSFKIHKRKRQKFYLNKENAFYKVFENGGSESHVRDANDKKVQLNYNYTDILEKPKPNLIYVFLIELNYNFLSVVLVKNLILNTCNKVVLN